MAVPMFLMISGYVNEKSFARRGINAANAYSSGVIWLQAA
jgi:surface polysaccharide O-acyltransferase-like enzyme